MMNVPPLDVFYNHIKYYNCVKILIFVIIKIMIIFIIFSSIVITIIIQC